MLPTKSAISIVSIVFLLFVSGSAANKKKNEEVQKKCDTCRALVKSFQEGMERTARYNFAGGDTDWEEKKLGKYSTSETRLIEIVEQLCSKDEHECNRLLEDHEEQLETWWKEHQTDQPDLLQWLCIDALLICCPDNRYGPECQDCPGGLERPCKGNGKCSGGGTRAGTGKCKCSGGYKGELCDVCKNGFYTETANETHTVCTACDESCAATCTKGGPTGCKKCKGGYIKDEEKGCQDIDECKQETPPCQSNEFCQNSLGSYQCVACHMACDQCIGEGPESCVKCKSGFKMEETTCKDIDECETDETCKKDHMFCKNVPGSFLCECEEGYLQITDGCVPKSVLDGKGSPPQPSMSLKDGDVPPAEETDQEADSTTAKGGEADSVGVESQSRATGGNESNSEKQNDSLNKNELRHEGRDSSEQNRDEL
ncbi:cysteine-rich with EGF-like domain protein 2 [Acanthaster planci]|uniref:protein disulfide-isomerase n=1 Tax=Acanthaster planci TaxID=133434 RepID=A0A8B7ZYY1_ACAPL|nr:cysteine-rich with EGF-like domain protein 2 [Acanthaster planci]